MSRKEVTKIKQYIKDDRPQRLKSYVSKHHIDLTSVELKHNRNLLHYCCQHGSGSVMRYLLKEKVDGGSLDGISDTPLHVALHRALRYEDTGRHAESTQCYTDLILPLIEKYPCLLDRTGVGGSTCRQLLGQLVRRRGHTDEVPISDSEEESIKGSREDLTSEKQWRDKLADEYQYEYQSTWGKYEQSFDNYEQEENAETYDDWTERIRQQYYNKKHAQREAHYAASNRKKRKTEESGDRKTDKLEEERRKMRERYERNQQKDKELRFLKRKMKYETDYKTLYERKVKTTLGYCDIPWPGGDKSEEDIVILMQGLESGASDFKKYLRQQQIRWHPDKFLQRFGSHIAAAEKDMIMKRVTELSQKLNKLSE